MAKKKFNGEIGFTVKDSRLSFEQEEKREKTNVVYIVLDDVGYAQLECFGSTIHTPNINRLAESGLRYNNFHTTAICSATRCSLLTGANHHAAGVASVLDWETGFPNSPGYVHPEYANLAEILKEYDYTNFAVGKWHLASLDSIYAQGPVDDWPVQKGFDHFYGFMNGCTDQYHPDLILDNTMLTAPTDAKAGYHLCKDLTDQAIHYLFQHTNAYPEKPFFLYLAYGTGHSPHQVPKEYIERYRGKFDEGWDAIREQWFARQKELGIIPQDAVLTERNEFIKPWDSLDANHKRVYARFMETYAGFLEYTDEQIGRVLDYLERIGERDHTIIALISDNGASAEGGQEGHFIYESGYNLQEEGKEFAFALEHIDEIGGEYSAPHYPAGWANAGNTPFKWYKSWTYSGGVKDPFIISYPAYIKEKGGIRSQYHHVSDITPTILDLLDLKKPDHIKGVAQKPFTGTSFKYSLNEPETPTQKPNQYYEMVGNRAIWKDGWKAITNHAISPSYEEDVWELYQTDVDYSEANNVADKYPEKLEELIHLWYTEAGKNGVFPLGNGSYLTKEEKTVTAGTGGYIDGAAESEEDVEFEAESFAYRYVIEPFRLGERFFLNQRNFYVDIRLAHKKAQEGILYSAGYRFGGYVVYIKGNKLYYTYNYHCREYYRAVTKELPEGELNIRIQTKLNGEEADVIVFVNGQKEAETRIREFVFMMEISINVKDAFPNSPDPEAEAPFEYSGIIDEISFHAAPLTVKRADLLEEFFNKD